jgi:hypothetical protein
MPLPNALQNYILKTLFTAHYCYGNAAQKWLTVVTYQEFNNHGSDVLQFQFYDKDKKVVMSLSKNKSYIYDLWQSATEDYYSKYPALRQVD